MYIYIYIYLINDVYVERSLLIITRLVFVALIVSGHHPDFSRVINLVFSYQHETDETRDRCVHR